MLSRSGHSKCCARLELNQTTKKNRSDRMGWVRFIFVLFSTTHARSISFTKNGVILRAVGSSPVRRATQLLLPNTLSRSATSQGVNSVFRFLTVLYALTTLYCRLSVYVSSQVLVVYKHTLRHLALPSDSRNTCQCMFVIEQRPIFLVLTIKLIGSNPF